MVHQPGDGAFYALFTGRSVIEGFGTLGGPGRWAVWLVVVPQILVAQATIAGLAGAAGSAAAMALPGGGSLWGALAIAAGAVFVARGSYGTLEGAARIVAVSLGVAALVAAISVLSSPAELARGLVPSVPPEVRWQEVLPWLGFALSGAAGVMWYSYWLPEKGYGVGRGAPDGSPAKAAGDREWVRGWLRQMSLDNTVAVLGTTLVTVAFLVLGTELLRRAGCCPGRNK